MGMNPWPGVFGWYCNPACRLFDFLLGYTGFLVLSGFSGELLKKKASLLQVSMLTFTLQPAGCLIRSGYRHHLSCLRFY